MKALVKAVFAALVLLSLDQDGSIINNAVHAKVQFIRSIMKSTVKHIDKWHRGESAIMKGFKTATETSSSALGSTPFTSTASQLFGSSQLSLAGIGASKMFASEQGYSRD